MTDTGSGTYVAGSGEFTRDQNYIATRITQDGRDGYPVEPGRYRLVVSRACPWASRAVVVRRLLGLEDAVSMGVCGPTHDARSWTFDLDPGGRDPVLGIERLQEAYFKRFPGYERGITVPAIVDIPTGQVVTNDYAQMTLDLSTQWRPYHRDGAPRSLPRAPARGDGRGHAPRLPRRQQRRLPVRVRRLAGGLREGLSQAVRPAGLALRPPRGPALPDGRHPHRGRRPAVHDPRPVRPRLPRPLQVQPAEADRDAGALGVRPGPVPDAGVRRHRRLRRHQAALLRGSPRHQPDAASCPPVPTWRAGSSRTAARSSAGGRSGTGRRRPRRPAPSACRPATTPSAAERGTAATGGSPLRLARIRGFAARKG